jgi:hypothetical protein
MIRLAALVLATGTLGVAAAPANLAELRRAFEHLEWSKYSTSPRIKNLR